MGFNDGNLERDKYLTPGTMANEEIKTSHERICRALGMTEDEIREDWTVCEKALKSPFQTDLAAALASLQDGLCRGAP
jgi:hypothetical protein